MGACDESLAEYSVLGDQLKDCHFIWIQARVHTTSHNDAGMHIMKYQCVDRPCML